MAQIETSEAVYDAHARMYIDFVDAVLAAEPSLFGILAETIERLLGPRIRGATVVDIACGEGYLSRYLLDRGAKKVVAVDISGELIAEARRRTRDRDGVSFEVGDAHSLTMLDDASVDVAVCQMAMMDIANHRAAFRAAARVLKAKGVLAFSLLHPCFEGPYSPPDEPQFLVDEQGVPTAVAVRRYGCEGHWRCEGAGLRGHVGSYHRMISTYLNDLISSGFRLERVEEPLPAIEGLLSRVPRVMVISATTS